jgi:hypothetical protein
MRPAIAIGDGHENQAGTVIVHRVGAAQVRKRFSPVSTLSGTTGSNSSTSQGQ